MKIAWLAPDGSPVERGDVVVRFDASDMERQLADSQDDVSTAERQIGKVQVESAASRHKREMTADLADVEAIMAKQFESQDANIFSRVEILESNIDLELAESKAEHARKVKAVERSVSSSQLALHRITQSQAARDVGHAEDGLAKLQIEAPHPGILVLARNWRSETVRVGDTVWQGQKLAELPLVTAMEAQAFVLEADAAALEAGLPAEVVIEAHPQVVHVAKVERVDTLAQPRHPDVPVHYFGVTLGLEQSDPEIMRVGQRVRATIRIEQPDAIIVPRHAIFDRESKTIVYRAAGDGFEAIEVTLGTSSAGRVVIEQGLEPGDRVALRDPTQSADASQADAPQEQKGAP
jgi:multidrug resistance efflux pump